MRYITLLRGINVGGNTMIKMDELRQMFEALGFERVTTYINSGNLAFDIGQTADKSSNPEETEELLVSKIESAIEDKLDKTIQVMVRTQDHILDILKINPFAFNSHKEMHVLFMKEEMAADNVEQLLSQQTENERFVVAGREIYCHLKLGVADSLLGKSYIEKKLKTPITARNWRTVQKLAEL